MNIPCNLVLVTIDCLRADHVGHLGYERPTTPFLDCLAQESLVFRNAIAAGSPTYYSLPAMLASRHPLALGRDLIGFAPEESTIASVLQESGFATAAFSAGNPYICPQFGYDRGFDVFCDFNSASFAPEPDAARRELGFRSRTNQLVSRFCHSLPGLGTAYDELYFEYCQRRSAGRESIDSLRRFPSADVIVEHALAWLKENSKRPFFLWLHFMDPHAPYFPTVAAMELMEEEPITAAKARYLNSYWARGDVGHERLAKKKPGVVKLYDAGIRWADEQIRRLTENLVELNLWDKCALAVTADHGEEFLDHGGRFHAPEKLTEELIHVPLLLRVPGVAPAQVAKPTTLIDLAPTLLDVLGLPSPADFRGRSWGMAIEKSDHERVIITEAVCGCSNPFHAQKRVAPRIMSVRKGNHKLSIDFARRTEMLFDLQSDPHEQMPIALTSATRHRELLEVARKHLAESHKSRDFDRRNAAILRELRIEWAHPAAIAAH